MDRRIALSRRDVLKLAIGVVALPVLSACTPSAPPAAPKTEAKPTEAPKPAAAKPTEVPKPFQLSS